MKAFVRTITKMIEDYEARKERMNYLIKENCEYSKMLSTLELLETSDANNDIISSIKEAFNKNVTFIEVYKEELSEIESGIERAYDADVNYSKIFCDDMECMIKTMKNNVSSDLLAGYSIAKIQEELREIEEYTAKKEIEYRELTSMPNVNERMFAHLVNHGIILID